MNLVLFDFDGTLTKRETLFAFIRFTVGDLRFLGGIILLSPVLAAHAFGFVGAERAKRAVLSYFFKGWARPKLETAGERFCAEALPSLMNEETLRTFESHKKSGAEVCLVSASCDAWLQPFCRTNGIRCICTELEYDAADRFTGRFRTPNCKGPEKRRRIEAIYRLADFARVIAYGNSSADLQMLEMAHEKHLLR